MGKALPPIKKEQVLSLCIVFASCVAACSFYVGVVGWLQYGGCFADEPCSLFLVPPQVRPYFIAFFPPVICVIAWQFFERILFRILTVFAIAMAMIWFFSLSFDPIYALVALGGTTIMTVASLVTLLMQIAAQYRWFQNHRSRIEELFDLQWVLFSLSLAVLGAAIAIAKAARIDTTCLLRECEILRSIPDRDLLDYGISIMWIYLFSSSLRLAKNLSRLLIVSRAS
ncbi:hypothetical protein ACFSM5_21200 [Lacibacterium aquatile]|uniref:Uncharacterized protein n=1 Tax=Lacibacterium aquatile TaxID=1168082 RepID=A0ABW5DWC6_9PROT